MKRISGFLSGLSSVALALAAIHGTILVVYQAHLDYGWLGVVVVLVLGVPFFWLLPVAGWWFLPTSQMIWLIIFLGVFLISSWGSSAIEKRSMPGDPAR
jgi:hypothetical protein